jgi:hypothetical protein
LGQHSNIRGRERDSGGLKCYYDPRVGVLVENSCIRVCGVLRLKREEGAGSSRTKIQGAALRGHVTTQQVWRQSG